MYQLICDKCKKTTEPTREVKVPKDWRTITYRIGSYGYNHVTFHFCQTCATELQIPEEPTTSIADQLVELISEITQDVVDNQDH